MRRNPHTYLWYDHLITMLLIGFLLAVSIAAQTQEQIPSSGINEPPAQKETSKTNETEKNTQEKVIPTSYPKAEQNPSPNQSNQNCFWQKFLSFSLTDALLAIFTLLLFIIGCFQYKILQNTLLKSRAFVFLKEIKVEPIMLRRGLKGYKEGQMWLFSPCWQNSGDTPTKNLTISINNAVFDDAIPKPFDFPYDNIKDIRMVIGPKAEIIVGAFAKPFYTSIEPLQGSQISNLYIWGEAKYNNVFSKKRHCTRFCIKMLFLTQQIVGEYNIPTFIYYDRYNCADEDCDEQSQ